MSNTIPSDHLILDRNSEEETPAPDIDARGAMDKLRGLAYRAAVRMEEILKDKSIPDTAKLPLVGIILDRVYGQPDEMLKIRSSENELESSRERIMDFVARVQNQHGETLEHSKKSTRKTADEANEINDRAENGSNPDAENGHSKTDTRNSGGED